MTIKKTLQGALLAGAVAAMLGIGSHAVYAQASTADVAAQRQAYAKMKEQEVAAEKSGHYNAADWKAKHQQMHNNWAKKEGSDAAFANHSKWAESSERQRDYARLKEQEVAAQRSGHYNAAYWKAKQDAMHAKWSKTLGY